MTRHSDIVQVGRQPEIFLNAPLLVIPEAARGDRDFEPPPTLIQMDPPEHGLQRRIIAKRFKPGALRRMHADIEQKGTPSRWVTLNARRALQRWYR